MKYFIRIVIIMIPLLVTTFVLKYTINKKQRNEVKEEVFRTHECVLKMPMLYRVVPCMMIIFAALLSIYVLIAQFEDWPYLIILVVFMGVPGIAMLTCFSLWKVEIDKEKFLYRNFLGGTKIYYYKDLEQQYDGKGIKWYFYKGGKKVFCMPYYIKNGNKLLRVYKKYQIKHRDKPEKEFI